MAGHSKWANIQHRKGAQDKKRGKLFTKLIREVTIAARMGGSDIGSNPRLRMAVDKAKGQSMPKDNIDRAIKRGAGELDGAEYVEIRYEGYGPGGSAVMVDCMTDNKNRSVADVRHAFAKFGGNLGADGSVNYLFNHVGLLSYPAGSDENAIMEAAIEAGAEDIVADDDSPADPGARVRADAARLPVPDNAACCVVLVNALLFPNEMARVLCPGGTLIWVSSLGDRTPIYLSAEDVAAALPGTWSGVSADAGWGCWCALRRVEAA